jgi:hypothetical protein
MWPPSIVTDFVYACSALMKWGLGDARAMLQQSTRDLYYKGDPPEQGSTSLIRGKQKRERDDRRKRLKERKSQGTQQEGEELKMGEVMDMVMCLWSIHSRPRESRDRSSGSQEWLEEWLQRQRN